MLLVAGRRARRQLDDWVGRGGDACDCQGVARVALTQPQVVDRALCSGFTDTMTSNGLVSMLCFTASTDELAAVLCDAACSFMDEQGRFHLARPVVASGTRRDVAEFCASVLADARERSALARIDLGAGREPVESGVLSNPIELLHWIISQSAAVDFHPTVNAYIFSSDPDDILPFLPFHPAPGRGGHGMAEVVALRLPIGGTTGQVLEPGAIEIDGYELSLPDAFE